MLSKIIFLKLKEIEEMSNKIDYEVKDVEQIMKQNQKALFLLREPFSTRLKMVNNAKLQKNDIFQDQNYRNNDADLETNDDNEENGKITPFEELMKVRFERLAKKLRGSFF